MPRRLIASLTLFLTAACGGDEAQQESGPATAPEPAHGGLVFPLTVEGWFELHIGHGTGTISIWPVQADGTELKLATPPTLTWPGDPVVVLSGTRKGTGWLFEHEALRGEPKGEKFGLRVAGEEFDIGHAAH